MLPSTALRAFSVCKMHVSRNILPVTQKLTNIVPTINQVTLLGRVGNDPIRRGSAEHPVVTFSLATHSNYAYSSGEVVKKTEWHRVGVFKPALRELAVNYVTKGQRVLIQGRLIYGEVKDSEGQSRQTSTIVADEIICFKKTEQ
nr:EOG090X0O5J [Eulimnadia texana]